MSDRAFQPRAPQRDHEVAVRRIVVATDHTVGTGRAVRWAGQLAALHDARLTVVLVTPSDTDDTQQAQLLAELEAFLRDATVGGRAHVAVGDDVAEAVVAVAEAEQADVLVVGNAGMRGRTEFLLGNVANRITHRSRCTTIVVQSSDVAHRDEVELDADQRVSRTARAIEIARVLTAAKVHLMLRDPGEGADARVNAVRLRTALEQLGPTFAKLGQVLSTRPDLVPTEFIEELSSLRSSVPPMAESEVVTAMERELGVPWEDVFASIDAAPIAAGTIGQVHRATMVDGSRVVVKVQRPSAAAVIERDLAVLTALARLAARSGKVRHLIDVVAVVDQLAGSLRAELDFQREAAHLERMAEVVGRYRAIGVPRCHREMSTTRLLVMDEVVGEPVDRAAPSPELTDAARELLASFFHQVLSAGFFHADPHPGNLMWADERLWLIDLGMVGEIDAATRQQLLMLLLAFWQGDGAFLADLLLNMAGADIGARGPIDVGGLAEALTDLAGSLHATSLAELEIGPLLERMTQIAVRFRVQLPAGLALVAKAMSQVQLTVTQLAPDQDLFAEARRMYLRDTVDRVTGRADPTKWIYELEKLRRGVDTIIEAGALAVGARPGKRLQIGFSSEQIERSVTRAGRTIALGFTTGLTILGAAIAFSSRQRPPR